MGEMSFQFLFQDSFLLFSVVEIASHYSFATVLAIAETFSAAASDGASIYNTVVYT